jgi:hypothetical protein
MVSARSQHILDIESPTKFPVFSIMAWGAIGIDYKSPMIIRSCNLDAAGHIEMLKRDFFEHAHSEHHWRPWPYVQDGATPRTVIASIEELTKSCVLCPSWPANSPDLNPVEMSWSLPKNLLRWNGIRTRETAISELLHAWVQIPMDVVNKLCASFPNRSDMRRFNRSWLQNRHASLLITCGTESTWFPLLPGLRTTTNCCEGRVRQTLG